MSTPVELADLKKTGLRSWESFIGWHLGQPRPHVARRPFDSDPNVHLFAPISRQLFKLIFELVEPSTLVLCVVPHQLQSVLLAKGLGLVPAPLLVIADDANVSVHPHIGLGLRTLLGADNVRCWCEYFHLAKGELFVRIPSTRRDAHKPAV